VTETIGAPPERVFAALTDVASFPRWRHGVSRVDVLSREPLRWREETDQGSMMYVYTETVPSRRLVSHVTDEDATFGGTWTFELAPAEARTRLKITENGFINPAIFRPLAKYAWGYDTTMRAFVADLRAHLH
jgi:uncharacterized protein YndB with AHSA1/START domain